MKKAMFFSLTAIFLVTFAIMFINAKRAMLVEDKDFEIKNTQLFLMQTYVTDFETMYVPEMLTTAAKEALVYETESGPTHKNIIEDTMKSGPITNTDDLFLQTTKTLTFLVGSYFDYNLKTVSQEEYDVIRLDFKIDYRFEAFDSAWSNSKDISIYLDVYGLTHPTYNKVIDDSWEENSTGCFVKEIIPDAQNCHGLNIAPG